MNDAHIADIEGESKEAMGRLRSFFGQCASAEGIHLWNRADARCERCGSPYPYAGGVSANPKED